MDKLGHFVYNHRKICLRHDLQPPLPLIPEAFLAKFRKTRYGNSLPSLRKFEGRCCNMETRSDNGQMI